MKRDRQAAILQLIAHNNITTQEELAAKLNQAGFVVTQATVSRDIRDLRLIKVVGTNGQPHYAVKSFGSSDEEDSAAARYLAVLSEAYVSSACAGNILVVKTATGMATAVAASIDTLGWNDVIGSIAGDDTIFLATAAVEDCAAIKERLDRIVKR
jgi:transcriptional regulator of arginine metabolism